MRRNGDGGKVPPTSVVGGTFPGTVALWADPPESTWYSVTTEHLDEVPWSLDVAWLGTDGHLLTVRTVRPVEGLDPRGLPVEDLAGAIVAAQLAAVDGGSSGLGETTGTPAGTLGDGPTLRPARSSERDWVRDQVSRSRSTRAQAAQREPVEVEVTVDGRPVAGRLVVVAAFAALELPWHGGRVFVAGLAEFVATARLRSGDPSTVEPIGNRY